MTVAVHPGVEAIAQSAISAGAVSDILTYRPITSRYRRVPIALAQWTSRDASTLVGMLCFQQERLEFRLLEGSCQSGRWWLTWIFWPRKPNRRANNS